MRTQIFLLSLMLAAPVIARSASSDLLFERDIRPILKAHCFDCHGEGETPKGGLDLRLKRLMGQGGESGPAIIEGKPDESLLYQKVRSGEMPKRDKKLTPDQIELIGKWIRAGAPTARPEPATVPAGMIITPEERAHWSFQPLKLVPIPIPEKSHLIRTPVDRFLARAMEQQDLTFSPDASKATLIRRVYLGLIGLPPSPEEVEAFIRDPASDAYERLVDRLLASPHYGERWARHWLDIAGYADSDGYTDADTPREYAYKYRDYVIRSFNADKPFDQFVIEQLAGDELVPQLYSDPEPTLKNPFNLEKIIATGFLRMGPDGTAADGIDHDAVRNQVMADMLKIVSTSLLGLSVGCAQCHDHRYDPIPQSDYYRLRAIFEPAYDWKNWRKPAQRLISLYTAADRAEAARIEAEAQKLVAEKEEKQQQFIRDALEKHLEKFDAALRDPLRAAFNTPADQRTPEQKKLLMDHPSVNINPGVLYQYNQKAADELKAMDAKISEIRGRRPVEDFVQALTEVPNQVPVTHVFHRGDPKQPKEAVAPGILCIAEREDRPVAIPGDDPLLPTTGRRLAFARWLTSGECALLPRVIVNRAWMHHFGRGLAGTPADFGMMGERPSHPELLDWLALQFATPSEAGGLGWSFKQLHRLIMTSTVYRQSSLRDSAKSAVDPENRFYWRKPALRLEAEVIRDAAVAVSGGLNPKMFGPPIPVREDLVGQVVVGVDKKQGDNKMPVDVDMGGEEFRRSVYIQVRRSRPLAFFNVFDTPVMDLNCEMRQNSTAPTQSLMLMNSQFVLDMAGRFAKRLRIECGDDTPKQIQRAWQLTFSRAPTENELQLSTDFVRRQTEASSPEQALTSLCQTLISANEFLYVD